MLPTAPTASRWRAWPVCRKRWSPARRAVLDQLEEGERQSPARQLVDDLPLFSVEVNREPTPHSGPSEVEDELADLNPDDMTPREALEALYALRAKLQK